MDYQQIIERKIQDDHTLRNQLNIWRLQSKKIVFTNGCFDILHKGHAAYLAAAKNLGDVLIVGLNSDKSVSCNKGPGRPVNNEQSRAFILASLHVVDAVVLFSDDTPYHLIQTVQPDVLVKGSDYKAEDIVGYDIVTARGGEVVTISLTEGFSTTSLINKLRN
ncbi:MAG: D-glycero-beta-D-manno-heptose 1-phosphate adenylyltransferase [Bacteroidetes bacterium]|jgi:rfaE bifunctional protein nucleotidyltransferase chain/domain|nr:D-glycero-beta-D-manno-heptose 1-phosphate adenylyltransferase [Bacteroidota bacterium]